MKPAPIFLLINGKADGPHEALDILDRLSGEALDEDNNPIKILSKGTLSCIEGMTGWRTLPETMLWAYSSLLAEIPGVEGWIHQMAEKGFGARKFRENIRQLLENADIIDPASLDYLEKILDVNSSLLLRHGYYQQRLQTWNPGAMDAYPAYKLEAFWKNKFSRNWKADWQQAGGKLYNGEMIARLDDPVWSAISDFGYPFPPFSFDTSMQMGCMSFYKAKKWVLLTLTARLSFQKFMSLNSSGYNRKNSCSIRGLKSIAPSTFSACRPCQNHPRRQNCGAKINILLGVVLTFLSLAGTALTAAASGLAVNKQGDLLLNGVPFKGIGVNAYDIFVRTLGVDNGVLRTNYLVAFLELAARRIPFVRFNTGGYWPDDWRLYQTNRSAYFTRLDGVVRSAEQHGIGLIPPLFWNMSTVPDLVGEPCNRWGDTNSRTIAFMCEYTHEVVKRYAESSAIWAWELGNEYKLVADLPNGAELHPPVMPDRGTPDRRTVEDELTHTDIRVAFREFALEVRKHDPKRIIISGNAFPRVPRGIRRSPKAGKLIRLDNSPKCSPQTIPRPSTPSVWMLTI